MKRLGIVLAIFAVTAFIGCTSSGSSKPAGGGAQQTAEPFIVDLSALPFTKNTQAFTRQYDDLLIPLPASVFQGVDFSKYRNVTILMNFYDLNNNQKQPEWSSNAIVTLVYETDVPDDNLRRGANVPVKELNGGMIGGDATISTSGGSRARLTKAPGGILLQNTGTDTGYIELTLMVFHNGEYILDNE